MATRRGTRSAPPTHTTNLARNIVPDLQPDHYTFNHSPSARWSKGRRHSNPTIRPLSMTSGVLAQLFLFCAFSALLELGRTIQTDSIYTMPLWPRPVGRRHNRVPNASLPPACAPGSSVNQRASALGPMWPGKTESSDTLRRRAWAPEARSPSPEPWSLFEPTLHQAIPPPGYPSHPTPDHTPCSLPCPACPALTCPHGTYGSRGSGATLQIPFTRLG